MEKTKNDGHRFAITYKQNTATTRLEVWVDRETGVNYLYHGVSYGGGLTVLLDKDGKPVISPLLVD